eukprot:s4532_g2.t2
MTAGKLTEGILCHGSAVVWHVLNSGQEANGRLRLAAAAPAAAEGEGSGPRVEAGKIFLVRLPCRKLRHEPLDSLGEFGLVSQGSPGRCRAASRGPAPPAFAGTGIVVLECAWIVLTDDYGTLCDCLRAKGVLTNEDLVEQGSRRLQAAAFQSLCRSPAAVRVVAEALGPAVAALSATSPCAASACRSTFLMEPAEQEKPQEAATPARRSVSTAEALEKVPGTTAVSSKSALSSRLLAHLIGVMWRAEERERPASIALHLKEVVRNLGHLAGATTAFKLSELCRCTADAPMAQTLALHEPATTSSDAPRAPRRFSAMALPMKTTMKKAMKGSAMKAKPMKAKAMKAMKRKAISKIAQGKRAKLAVFKGSKEKTYTGLRKTDLMKSKSGRIVSKKQHAKGKALFQQFAKKWVDAVITARKELGLKGFCAVGGKSAQGKALYAKAKTIYAA